MIGLSCPGRLEGHAGADAAGETGAGCRERSCSGRRAQSGGRGVKWSEHA